MTIYSHLSDSLNLVKINQEVKSVQRNYEDSIVIIKQRILFGIIAAILSLIIILCLKFHLRLRKREKYLRQQIEEIKKNSSLSRI